MSNSFGFSVNTISLPPSFDSFQGGGGSTSLALIEAVMPNYAIVIYAVKGGGAGGQTSAQTTSESLPHVVVTGR